MGRLKTKVVTLKCIVFPVLFPGLQSLFAKIGVKFIPTETENFFSDVVSQAIDIREKDTSVSVDIFVDIDNNLVQNIKD